MMIIQDDVSKLAMVQTQERKLDICSSIIV